MKINRLRQFPDLFGICLDLLKLVEVSKNVPFCR